MRHKFWIGAAAFAFAFASASVSSSKVLILQIFEGSGALYPLAGVTIDHSGDIFGTSNRGGNSNNCVIRCGEVFETQPVGHRQWTTSALYDFQNGDDGPYPQSPLTLDASGNLYGSSSVGSSDTEIYRLAPQG